MNIAFFRVFVELRLRLTHTMKIVATNSILCDGCGNEIRIVNFDGIQSLLSISDVKIIIKINYCETF